MRCLLIICFVCNFAFSQTNYQKNYSENGILESAGWFKNGQKIKYWRFYYPNGNVKSEGHYKHNQKTKFWRTYRTNGKKLSEGHFNKGSKVNWWIFYDENEKIDHKCQLKNNQKNGYCLMYVNSKLTSASKYSLGKKVKEWFDFKSFKRENSLRDLK